MAMITILRDHACAVEWRFLPGADHFGTHLCLADAKHEWSTAIGAWIARDGATTVSS